LAVKEISSPLFVGWQRWRWFSFFGCFLPLVASAGDEVEWILVLQGGSGEILVLLGFPREVGWGPSVGLRMDLVRVGREFAGSLVGFCEGIWDSWPARSLLHLCEGMVASSHPHGGMWIPSVSFRPGGGGCFRRTSMEKMPMFVQSFRCGLVVVPSRWLLRLHMCGSSSFELCWRRRWPAASSFCGEASGGLEKNLEEVRLCKEVLLVLVCNFLFFPGCDCNLGMYCYCPF